MLALPQMSRRSVLLSGLAGLTVAACGDGSGDAPVNTLLRVAISREPDSLDPTIGQFAASALMYKQLYAPLTDYGQDLGVAPGLAESWAGEDGGTRWVFTLRDGLEWSDGQRLTAEDVVWTARRLVDPQTATGGLGDFYAVENAEAILAGEADILTLGVRALNRQQVEFQLSQPISFFDHLMREFYPLPRHAIERHGNGWVRPENFVGSGPFILTDAGGLSYDLRRNTHAYNPAQVDAVRISVVDDAATRARMFQAGEFDIAEAPYANQIPSLREAIGEQVHSFAAPKLVYLKLNLRNETLQRLSVRTAMAFAIDRTFLANELMLGLATPTMNIIRGGNTPILSREDGLASARALLEEFYLTGENAPRVTLRTTGGERERLAVAIADDWNEAGIVTEILSTEPIDMYSAVDGGDFDVALSSFDRGLKMDPNFMMEPFAPGGFADDSGWFGMEGLGDEFFRDLIERGRQELDAQRRDTLYRGAEVQMLNQHVVIPLLHEDAHWLISNRVSGLTEGMQPQLWQGLGVPSS